MILCKIWDPFCHLGKILGPEDTSPGRNRVLRQWLAKFKDQAARLGTAGAERCRELFPMPQRFAFWHVLTRSS